MNLDEHVPDERELNLKRAELAALATDLVERELALSTLQQALAAFQAEYLRVVGTSYAVLDDICARTAEARAAQDPDGEAFQERARRLREQAEFTAAQAEDGAAIDSAGPLFDPSAPFQRLYRAVGLELHPDLASTDDERVRRGAWMQKLDAAYKRQDVDAANALRAEWAARHQPVQGHEAAGDVVRAWLFGEVATADYTDRTRVSSDVVRTTRQIAQVRRRIDDIRPMIDDLQASHLHRLYCKYTTRLDSGVNLLDEMAAKVGVRIAEAAREAPDVRDPGAVAECDASDLLARGLADLDRWQRIHCDTQETRDPEATTTAGEARFEFSVEQWNRLRPGLDHMFLAVRRELRPGQNLIRKFVRAVRKALIKDAGLPKAIAREACVRWNRETRGGRDVEVAETDSDQPGPRPPGPAAAGGTSADGTMGAGRAATVPPTRAGRHGVDDGSQGPGAVRADGAGTPSAEPKDDADGGRSAHQTRAVLDSQGPVVAARADAECGAALSAEDCFNRGRWAEQDRKNQEAARWFRRAAERGHAEAPYHLGLMYLNGQGVSKAHDASARWLRQAADQGHALAQRNLAVLYFKGQGVPRDHAATVEWLKRAAVQGCVLAQVDLARVYLKGDGVQDPVAAVSWLHHLAEGGHRDEQYYLGLMYFNGQGVSRSHTAAAVWFRRAADQFHHEAEYRLGLMYRDGQGVPQSFGNSAGWLRRAAACGHAKARFVRDRIYRTGKLIPHDPQEQFDLADGYFTGHDMPRDHEAAARWFLSAANQGHADAAYRLGGMYCRGQGVSQDHAEAAKFLRYAADHRHWSASRDLAVLYFYGRGVPRNHDAAAMWLRRAAATEIGRYGPADATTRQQCLW